MSKVIFSEVEVFNVLRACTRFLEETEQRNRNYDQQVGELKYIIPQAQMEELDRIDKIHDQKTQERDLALIEMLEHLYYGSLSSDGPGEGLAAWVNKIEELRNGLYPNNDSL